MKMANYTIQAKKRLLTGGEKQKMKQSLRKNMVKTGEIDSEKRNLGQSQTTYLNGARKLLSTY